MKKLLAISRTIGITLLICFGLPMFQNVYLKAQTQKVDFLKIDPKIRFGFLDNGITYYIRHNEMPKERAEFYLVQNVGSMQEEERQRGLAHFLEHMAFNGSKHFPSKKGIQDYIESAGMRMGENVNAYTGFDETVYMLMNVPVTSQEVIDSCMYILHDWSSFLLLDDEAIEKERGVIREEWRTSRSAQMRLWEQQLPKMYPNSRYGTRLPIGTLDVIENFTKNELEAYYKEWYRPDLQAVIIIGDIDVDKIEEQLKTLFADIKKPDKEKDKELYVVPDNEEPLVSIAKDKEMPNLQLSIYYKHEKLPFNLKGTIADVVTNYTQSIISLIMRERFSDIVQKPEPPFVAGYANDGDYLVAKTKGAWTATAIVKPNELDRAMKALVIETEKVRKFGITESEYERAKENMLKSYENAFNERDNEDNSNFAQEYIGHFTNHDYIPGIEVEYGIMKQIAANLPVEGINTFIKQVLSDVDNQRNIVIGLTGPDKEDISYPSEEELLAIFLEANKMTVEKVEEEKISKVLVPVLPTPGKIVSEKKDDLFGTTNFQLSNGVTVILKETDYKKDQILMNAISPGGTSMFKDKKDIWNLKVINDAILLGGFGEFSNTTLSKALAGKNVSGRPGLTLSTEIITGSASPKDLKSLFEIIYLQFTAIRMDNEAYSSAKERMITQLENEHLNPNIIFSNTIKELVYDKNPRSLRITAKDFEKIDYNRMINMYKERFADASDFIFTFVGNINEDTIRPLIEQYLGALPSLNRKDIPDEKQDPPFHKGKVKKHFPQKLETPKASVGLMYTGKMPYNLKNVIITQVLNYILDFIFVEKIREDNSASYDVFTRVDLYDFPLGRSSLQIYFDTNKDSHDKMIDIVKSELNKIANDGPPEGYFTKSINNILRGRNDILQQNDYWLNTISAYYFRNMDAHSKYEEILKSLTKDDIQKFTKDFLKQGNEVEVVMYPE